MKSIEMIAKFCEVNEIEYKIFNYTGTRRSGRLIKIENLEFRDMNRGIHELQFIESMGVRFLKTKFLLPPGWHK